MLYYIFPYLFLFLFSFLYYKLKDVRIPGFVALSIFLIPAILLVILKGDVGTDTINYLTYFKDIYNGTNLQKYEPGFELLANTITFFGFNERVGVAIVSMFTIVFLVLSFSDSKIQIVLFSALLFPIFFYDMTMNGLRYGLSFSISAFAIHNLYLKKNLKFLLFGLIALSIQYSSALIIFIFILFKLNKTYLLILVALLLISSPLIGGYFADSLNYLYDKQDFYKDMASPGATSGIGPYLLFLMLLATSFFYTGKDGSLKILILLLVLETGAFLLARITYAGLRLQTLFLFAQILLIKEEFILVKKRREYLMILTFIGLFGFMLTLKNLSAVVEDVESPFIPYKFFWQESA